VSKSELDFALQALRQENVRVDGRALAAYRRFNVKFGTVHGEVEVSYGPTRALAVCSGEIVTPPPERPNEGRIAFHVEFGPIASPSFEVGRPSAKATAVSNFVERLIKGSRAIDAEALCIVGGQKVWSIRVDVRALDDDGNLGDVCSVAALCSLLHFRKAEVNVQGTTAKAFSEQERVPVPLSIHHLPVPVTFALFEPAPGSKEAETMWIADPNRLEEVAMAGALTVAVNQHGELCCLHKPGGMPVDFALIEHCTELAIARAKELTTRIQSELEADLEKRKQSRRNVHQQYAQAQLLTVSWSEDGAAKASLPQKPGLHLQKPKASAKRPAPPPIPTGVSGRPPAPPVPAAAKKAKEAPPTAADLAGLEGRDIDAELEAVLEEAAELEEQLAAAAEAEEAAPAAASTGEGEALTPRKRKKKLRAR